MPIPKTEQEIREYLAEVLAVNPTDECMVAAKVCTAKTLLWVLGEDDDDELVITVEPGPPVRPA